MTVSPKSIDDIIHGRLRLGIMAYLSTVSPASFPELQKKTGATHGNLSTHLSKLEHAGYIRQEKGYRGKRPQTLVYLTDTGREAWIAYLEVMRDILEL
ncbi:MAG TPA: transcriptional regulator [Hellea balneolensis]|uniref:Transcriptional regulator n=1 Tax=Hellea balneolensis TaxID=287478 RepID=A0A7V5U0S9_9PROT|nr:transcriptional regulator [Hellea balneolensis]